MLHEFAAGTDGVTVRSLGISIIALLTQFQGRLCVTMVSSDRWRKQRFSAARVRALDMV